MKRFESTKLPVEHSDFLDQLREEHSASPFLFSRSRENIRRISDIAFVNNIEVVPVRGLIDFSSWSYDTFWVSVLGDHKYLIDLSVPVKNRAFVDELGRFVARSTFEIPPYQESVLLEKISRKAEFEERVIAEIPDGVSYFGKKFFI